MSRKKDKIKKNRKSRKHLAGRRTDSAGAKGAKRTKASKRTKAAKAAKASGFEPVTGILEKNKAGFGFVRREDGDIFISRSNMNGAMHGDTVSVDMLPEYLWDKNREGIVDKIIERASAEVVGTFEKNKKFGFVVPEDPRNTDDVYIRKSNFSGAHTGDRVVATILKYPDRNVGAEGRISEIIARRDEPGADIMAMIRSRGLRETFPSRANAEAKAMAKAGISARELRDREDLRDRSIITIDGAESKDLDDAVEVRMLENGNYLLGVHIADVSHYVENDGPLDKEAFKRGNSVYLLSRVVPMLPKNLSNGICSLNPGEDRLTLSCEMEVNKAGDVVNHRIFESVINSKARMVYDDVSDILENDDPELEEKYSAILDELRLMGELAALLSQTRHEKGSIDFDLDESEIVLDENEVPVDVFAAERRIANRLIEEFMLLANETVAEHFLKEGCPFVYRVHERPDGEKLSELRTFLEGLGITLNADPDSVTPADIGKVLEKAKAKNYENIVGSVTLRSMKKAVYSTSCDGHFGLAFRYYCHFTSPIRRYPDLMIHRIIKESLKGATKDDLKKKYAAKAEAAAVHSSETERKAQELERDVEKMKKAEYMEGKVGETFYGVISGVTSFGIYVELADTVEGLVRIERMRDDYYFFQPEKYRLVGEHTGRTYSLGDKVEIVVLSADPAERHIDFGLLQ